MGELSSSQASSEEKLNHEAEELEKRLSMLSHGSSTGRKYGSAPLSLTLEIRTGPPLHTARLSGGDDRSISGSSDASDSSLGSRLVIWAEPASVPPANVGPAKTPLQIGEKLPASQGVVSRPASKTPRQLQEIGRQSSSDSGIATGSHSSYSGSFSSYTGSLDITSGEDFGSVFSLPPHLAQELSPCTCTADRGREYQVPAPAPAPAHALYDTPRSLLQEASGDAKNNEPSSSAKDTLAPSDLPTETERGSKISSEGLSDASERQSISEHSQGLPDEGRKTKTAPSSDACHTCSSLTSASKTTVTICSACGGFKGTLYTHSSSLVTPVKKTLQKSSPGSGSIRSTEPPGVKTGEESAPFKRGEKLAGLLSDLLSFPSADRRPEAKAHRLNLYESMSPALGHGPSSAPAVPPQDHRDKSPVIYENCTKCRRAHCHPPPRAMPAKRYGSGGDIATFQAFSNGPHLTESQERDCAADEEPLHQSLRNIDGRSQHEEMNGWTVNCEDEKRHSKGERCRADPAYATMESCLTERNVEIAGNGAGCLCTFKAEEKSKYELMGSYGQRRFLHEAEGPVFACPPEAPLSDRSRNEGATYVNIPVSPTSKKQVNYMELELQEPGPGARGTGAHLPAQRKSSTRYAHIDITATETAHKVGTQHALGRQEGLQTLELRRKGTPR
ncbi:uncharacterized protein LOC133420509 [Cololabis saira]|uniref:uncharacterized protein LOC133420509 n=1 Tax=Cololabis saira TaxID=129043 RepID=UPI002AD48019|nr:uncharacterized protein LOC133420509 [Cololabis saira]